MYIVHTLQCRGETIITDKAFFSIFFLTYLNKENDCQEIKALHCVKNIILISTTRNKYRTEWGIHILMIGCLGLVEHYFKPGKWYLHKSYLTELGNLTTFTLTVTWWSRGMYTQHSHTLLWWESTVNLSTQILEVPKYAFVDKIDVYVYENELWRGMLFTRGLMYWYMRINSVMQWRLMLYTFNMMQSNMIVRFIFLQTTLQNLSYSHFQRFNPAMAKEVGQECQFSTSC